MSIPKRLRFQVFARDDFACRYCGRRAPDVVLHVDHVLAKARGGTDTIGNLVTACADCNLGKGVELIAPQNGERTWDGFPSYWLAPDDDLLQVAMCDPDFFPEPVV